jgi:heat-inducible transcriptional repressor
MLTQREEIILNSIVRQYIERAAPVSSANVLDECRLDVSSATIRNEVARLEEKGYIIRPHYAAGSVPSDKGYRYYVSMLKNAELPTEEQFLISHLFHQVEDKLEEWLNLAATVLAQHVQNVAMVTTPRTASSKFKHMEMVVIQPHLALLVLVLQGAKVRQQLVSFEDTVTQEDLAGISDRLNRLFASLPASQIKSRAAELSDADRYITDFVWRMMQAEDNLTGQNIFLEGWHFLVNQPEFNHSQKLANLLNLVEQRKLIEYVVPDNPGDEDAGVKVIIGHENKVESIQDCSLVISRYGLPNESMGSIAVFGPTRMDYYRTISVIRYMSSLISFMITELYGLDSTAGHEQSE